MASSCRRPVFLATPPTSQHPPPVQCPWPGIARNRSRVARTVGRAPGHAHECGSLFDWLHISVLLLLRGGVCRRAQGWVFSPSASSSSRRGLCGLSEAAATTRNMQTRPSTASSCCPTWPMATSKLPRYAPLPFPEWLKRTPQRYVVGEWDWGGGMRHGLRRGIARGNCTPP